MFEAKMSPTRTRLTGAQKTTLPRAIKLHDGNKKTAVFRARMQFALYRSEAPYIAETAEEGKNKLRTLWVGLEQWGWSIAKVILPTA